MYIYRDHLYGELYVTDEEHDEICEQCGDSDDLVAEGEADEIMESFSYGLTREIGDFLEIKEVLEDKCEYAYNKEYNMIEKIKRDGLTIKILEAADGVCTYEFLDDLLKEWILL